MAEAIDTQQPGSKNYRVMTAVAYYAGLRPSEVVMLRVRSTELPAEGWGRLEVTEADSSFDEPGEPKTGPRSVPIPPVLVAMLREWVHDNNLTSPDRLLFRTRNDTMPSGSKWARAWHRALESVGQRPMRIYDCRHAAATTWLRAGMPLAETARRLGHSVETLVSTYVGALDDEEQIANQRVDSILGEQRAITCLGHCDVRAETPSGPKCNGGPVTFAGAADMSLRYLSHAPFGVTLSLLSARSPAEPGLKRWSDTGPGRTLTLLRLAGLGQKPHPTKGDL